MGRITFMLIDAAIAAVMFVPLFFYLNHRCFHSRRRSLWYFLLAVYLSGVYAIVGLPDICYIRLDLHFNIVPFAYMFSDYKNSLLNVLLFVPLGFFLPVFGKRYANLLWTVLFGFCFSLAIELMQIFTFRATDINDLMTNTFGAAIGWCIGRFFIHFFPGYPLEERSRHIRLTFMVSFIVMFFLHPVISRIVFPLFLK